MNESTRGTLDIDLDTYNIDQVIECISLPRRAENDLMWKVLQMGLQPYHRGTPVREVWRNLHAETQKALKAAWERDDVGEMTHGECSTPWTEHSWDGSCP